VAGKAAPMRHTFRTSPDAPGLVEAASVVLGVLGLVKHRSLASLAEAVAAEDRATCDLLAGVVLPERIEQMLADPDVVSIMQMLRAKVHRDRREKALTLAQCPQCSGWVLCGSGTPGRCPLTRDCPGKPVRASAASRLGIELQVEDKHGNNGQQDEAESDQSELIDLVTPETVDDPPSSGTNQDRSRGSGASMDETEQPVVETEGDHFARAGVRGLGSGEASPEHDDPDPFA